MHDDSRPDLDASTASVAATLRGLAERCGELTTTTGPAGEAGPDATELERLRAERLTHGGGLNLHDWRAVVSAADLPRRHLGGLVASTSWARLRGELARRVGGDYSGNLEGRLKAIIDAAPDTGDLIAMHTSPVKPPDERAVANFLAGHGPEPPGAEPVTPGDRSGAFQRTGQAVTNYLVDVRTRCDALAAEIEAAADDSPAADAQATNAAQDDGEPLGAADQAGLSAEERAIAVLTRDPGMTMQEVADAAGCSRGHLYRCEWFMKAKRGIESGRMDRATGRRDARRGTVE